MSSRSRVVVAVLIVAGIAGLILFDLTLASSPPSSSASSDRAAPPPADPIGQGNPILLINDSPAVAPAVGPAPVERESPANALEELLRGDGKVMKDPPQPAELEQPPAESTYTVLQGDSWWKIAEKVYGTDQGHHYKRIQERNPEVRGDFLRVGAVLVIPPAPNTISKEARAVPSAQGADVYMVRRGDTLGEISHRVYGTVKYAQLIFERNRDVLRSADMLREGIQLLIPPKPDDTGTGIHAAVMSAGGGTVHKVQQGESLWTIAQKYAPGRTHEMLQAIIRANPERLSDRADRLRVGWDLVIPE